MCVWWGAALTTSSRSQASCAAHRHGGARCPARGVSDSRSPRPLHPCVCRAVLASLPARVARSRDSHPGLHTAPCCVRPRGREVPGTGAVRAGRWWPSSCSRRTAWEAAQAALSGRAERRAAGSSRRRGDTQPHRKLPTLREAARLPHPRAVDFRADPVCGGKPRREPARECRRQGTLRGGGGVPGPGGSSAPAHGRTPRQSPLTSALRAERSADRKGGAPARDERARAQG